MPANVAGEEWHLRVEALLWTSQACLAFNHETIVVEEGVVVVVLVVVRCLWSGLSGLWCRKWA